MDELERAMRTAERAAREGSAVLTDLFRTLFRVSEKSGDRGLVTEADQSAETAIFNVLQRESSFGILSEESGAIGRRAGPQWVVDPLDGTTNFARGIPLFSVSIALVENFDVLVGAIADPIHDEVFAAGRDVGAYMNGKVLQLRPCVDKAPAVFVNHGYPESDQYRAAEVTRRLVGKASIRKLGSTALELTHVASGNVDGFICSGDEFWDFAAGLALATAAGCRVSDWRGNPWNGSHTFVLVARPEVHGSLVELIGDLQDTTG